MTPLQEARRGRRCRPRCCSRSGHVKRRDGLPQVRGRCRREAPGPPGGAQVCDPREALPGPGGGGQGNSVTGSGKVWGAPGPGTAAGRGHGRLEATLLPGRWEGRVPGTGEVCGGVSPVPGGSRP